MQLSQVKSFSLSPPTVVCIDNNQTGGFQVHRGNGVGPARLRQARKAGRRRCGRRQVRCAEGSQDGKSECRANKKAFHAFFVRFLFELFLLLFERSPGIAGRYRGHFFCC